jgi:hypothetical protein
MRSKYDRKVRVTLSAGEWLSIRCALTAARMYNSERNYHATNAKLREIKAKIDAQTDAAIDAADAEIESERQAELLAMG